jgi:hypothetical protein
MSTKAQNALVHQKEARQKKILFILLPVFLLLIAWQGPKTVKALTGGSAAPAAPTTTTSTTNQPPIDPSSAPAPSTSAPSAPAASAGPALADSDPLPARGTDQLQSFSLFEPHDPFLPRSGAPLPTQTGAASSGTTSSGTQSTVAPAGSTAGTQTGSGTTGSSQQSSDTATVQVNGSQAKVALDEAFPKSNPLFKITKIGANYIRVGLVSGSYLNGARTQKIAVGHSLTLVKQPEGTPFRISLLGVSFVTG